ncbi:MAG: hypothetical protein AB9900_02415 [Humidesulfovibrio sp.]
MKNTNLTPPPASQAYIYIRLSSQAQAWGDGERRHHDAALWFVETHSLPVAESLDRLTRNRVNEALLLLLNITQRGADPEDPDEYRAKNIFWVPPEAVGRI